MSAVGVWPRREAGPCPAPCGASPSAAAPTLVPAVSGQCNRAATPSQEGEGGRHQTIHNAALPSAQLQAAIWRGEPRRAGQGRRRHRWGLGTEPKKSPRILKRTVSPTPSHCRATHFFLRSGPPFADTGNNTLSKGLGIYLRGRALGCHARGPRFNSQNRWGRGS